MAGIQIIGAIGIKVTPDLTGFRQKLQAELSKIKDDFTVNINVDTSRATSQMAAWQARQEAKPVEKKFTLDRSAFDLASDTIANFTKSALGNLAKAGLGVTALVGSFNLLASLGSLLASSVGVIGLIPGALVGAGAALAVIKLGMDGIKEAFKDAAPAAQELKNAVSDTFRRELVPGVEAAKAILPQLKSGFSDLAKTLSGIANSVLTAFKTEGISTFKATLTSVNGIFANLGKAVAPLVLAFLNIAKIGAEMFLPMTQGAGTAAQQFLDFTKSAEGIQKIKGWIQGGIDAFKVLWDILSTIGSILKSVISAFGEVGGSLGSGITGPLHALDDFLKSSDGRDILLGIADAFKTIASTVTGLLKQAFQSLGPAVLPALSIIKQLAVQLGTVLGAALRVVGPILTSVFTFIKNNMGFFGPLAIAIGAVALAVGPVVTAFTFFKTAIMGVITVFNLLRIAFLTNPFLLLIAAVVAIAVLIITHWTEIKEFLIGVWNGIKTVAETVWNAIKDFFTSVLTGIGHFFRDLWNDLWRWASDRITNFKNNVRYIFDEIIGFFPWLMTTIGHFFRDKWNELWRWASDRITEFKEWVRQKKEEVVRFFRELPGNILSALASLPGILFNIGMDILNSLWNGMKAVWNRVTGWLKGLAAQIIGLKGPPSYDRILLIPAGRQIMEGFQKGLMQGWRDVESDLSAVSGRVEDRFTSLSAGSRLSGSVAANISSQGSVLVQAGNSLEEKIASALDGWAVYIDARGVGTLARKGSSLNAIR